MLSEGEQHGHEWVALLATFTLLHVVHARVLNAYWNGAVAVSAFLANCWDNVPATKRRKTSLTTMPFTHPDGFRQAVIRPPQCRENRLWDLSPGEDLIPIKETNVLKSCQTAPELHLVRRFGCSSQMDLHPTGQTTQVPIPKFQVGRDLLVVVVDALDWLTLSTWQTCLGQPRLLRGRALPRQWARLFSSS